MLSMHGHHVIPPRPADIRCLTESQPFASASFRGRTFYNSDNERTIRREGGWYALHAGSMRKLRPSWILSDHWSGHPPMSELPKGVILGVVLLGPREETAAAIERTAGDQWIHPGFSFCHEILEAHEFATPVRTGRKYGARWSLGIPEEVEAMREQLRLCELYQ